MTGVHMLHVPYRAATSAMTDLIGGGVQLMMVNTPVSGPHAQAGRVRALGISSLQRSPTYPDMPAIAETGARLRGHRLGRHHGSGQHAQGHRGAAERRDSHRAGQPGACASVSRCWAPSPTRARPRNSCELSRRETAKWARIVKFSGAKID